MAMEQTLVQNYLEYKIDLLIKLFVQDYQQVISFHNYLNGNLSYILLQYEHVIVMLLVELIQLAIKNKMINQLMN